MSYKSRSLFASVGMLCMLGASASAATLHLDNVSPTASMKVTFPTLPQESTPYVGIINWTFDRNLAGNAELDGLVAGTTLSTFCVEGTQNVYLNQNTTFANILSDISAGPDDGTNTYAMGAVSAGLLNKFWNVHYSEASLSNTNAAAFQLGVWEIVYDGDASLDLTGGTFKAESIVGNPTSVAAFSQAQSWLAGLPAANPTEHYQLFLLSDSRHQDQVFGVQTFGSTRPVPLPAAFPAGLSGLVGLAMFRRSRARRA